VKKESGATQQSLFPDSERPTPRSLLLVGEQKDIRYYAALPKSVLNGPAATGMGFWSINPYVGCAFGCAYCYARYAHRYTAERIASASSGSSTFSADASELPPWLAFERRILVKREAGAIVRRELRRLSRYAALQRETVVIGTATDPYQPAERRYRVTRGVLEVLAEQRGLSVTIITKSPLVTRDLDLLSRINERLWVGHFDVSAEEESIMFRHALLLRGVAGVSAEQIEDLVELALVECERFYPAFQLVIWGGKAPEEAMAATMIEPIGEA
jgi:hypothetical protein